MWKKIGYFLFSICLTACDADWNNPYPADEAGANIYYSDFDEQPKFLDPARVYTSSESAIINQIYEPPLQYHYLLEPYELIPLTAATMPTVTYYNAANQPLPTDTPAAAVAYTVYEIKIKPGIVYQMHPAFVKKDNGDLYYYPIAKELANKITTINDFPQQATRELVAEDYVYQIKRLANPELNSPILGLMNKYIVGLKELSQNLAGKQATDLRSYSLSGVTALDKYTYQIKVMGKYPQFLYWLAFSFFSPMPWEADVFYSQKPLIKKNIIIDWYPVGTGPYTLAVNNPNRKMVLEKNPNFRVELYPDHGMPNDAAKGLLKNAGQRLPFIDKVVFNLEKESIPRWTKFLQGYYDESGISSDEFEQATEISGTGIGVDQKLADMGIKLNHNVPPFIWYWGFNYTDPVVGTSAERTRLLRQAISIAFDMEEYISVFLSNQGLAAQSPIPPGIPGYVAGKAGINPWIYDWQQNVVQRKSLATAKELLAQAGYPGGRDIKTGRALVLNYDVIVTGDPQEKARILWVKKQFDKLNIQLNIRGTDYNRFREKLDKGDFQIFSLGWSADYPDPENFLFLFYSGNGRIDMRGMNNTNYDNPEYDALYEKFKYLENSPERDKLITQMIAILQHDAPWIWGFFPQAYRLSHQWMGEMKLNEMAGNALKYYQLDPQLREKMRLAWNKPMLWPFAVFALVILAILLPISVVYYYQVYRQKRRRIK